MAQELELIPINNDPGLQKQLARLHDAIQARAANEPPPPAKKSRGVLLQFPLPFAEQTRIASNIMIRSALFAPVKERQFFKDYVTLLQTPICKIAFAGEQLNQDDHDTFLQLLVMARHKEFGVDVVQPVNAVLKGIGRATRQEQRRQLFQQISRLVRGSFTITLPGMPVYEGHLLDDRSTPEQQQTEPRYRRHLQYRLNPKLAQFFAPNHYTLFNMATRRTLKGTGSELAKWLQPFFDSHVTIYPTKVETYWKESGSANKTPKSFRQKLRQALDLLKEKGIITASTIDPTSDLVTVEKTPSAAQQTHLRRKKARQRYLAEGSTYDPTKRRRQP